MYLSVSVYGLEACPLNKSELYSLDFVVSRLFMKHFNTSDISFVKRCKDRFNFAHAQRCTRALSHEVHDCKFSCVQFTWLRDSGYIEDIVATFTLTWYRHCIILFTVRLLL